MFLKLAVIIFAATSIVASSIPVKRQASGVVTCNLLVSPQSEVPQSTNILRLHADTLEKVIFTVLATARLTDLRQSLSTLDTVLEPLERVYTALAHVARCIQEAEAILEAFAEELGDISLSSPDRKESQNATARASDVDMVKRLKEVLNDCKGM